MNTIDLINKVSLNNNVATGRAEMIISLIVEKIMDRLKKDGEVSIVDFGKFKLETKNNDPGNLAEYGKVPKTGVIFTPEKKFLDIVNT
jgi:nucleoid DNA-binding protein